jgi:hypothetical protein
MSTLSLPSGRYQPSAFDALITRAQRAFVRSVQGLWAQLSNPPSSFGPEPRNAQELLEYAWRVEASQPAYAADLRSAALRHLGDQDRQNH